ncbi:hypothetical protein [Microbulbifer sp.]|nr:hypothetical protein [Microbulbifer sp.]
MNDKNKGVRAFAGNILLVGKKITAARIVFWLGRLGAGRLLQR